MKSRVNPIRLAGKRVLPLADGFEPSIALPTTPRLPVNLHETLAEAGFDQDERLFLEATRIHALSYAQLQRLSGWNAAQLDRIRKSIARKIRAIATAEYPELRYEGGSSVCGSYEERGVWSLATIAPDVIAEEIARARAKSFRVSGLPEMQVLSPKVMGKVSEIVDALATERLKLAAIIAKAGEASVARSEAERQLNILQAELNAEEEAIIIDDSRKPDPGLRRRLDAARERLEKAASKEGAFDRAISRQRGQIASLEEQVNEKRAELFRLALEQPAADLASVMRQAASVARKIDGIRAREARTGHDLASALFPPAHTSDDPYEGLSLRVASVGLFNAALVYAAELDKAA